MNNSLRNNDYFENLPLILKEILLSRSDLLDLKYDANHHTVPIKMFEGFLH